MRSSAGVVLVFFCCFSACAFAQAAADKSPAQKKPPAASPSTPKAEQKSAPAPAAKAGPPPQVPDQFKLNMMIRSMIIAVNQANKTANYTVLRGLGSPSFQAANSPDHLGAIFESLRKTKFDLSPIMFFTPKLLRVPATQDDGMLRLTGFFDTRPQVVTFDFLFENVGGEWMLFGIDLGLQTAPANGGQNAPAASMDQSGKP